jgi:hypothetical protein
VGAGDPLGAFEPDAGQLIAIEGDDPPAGSEENR